MQIYNTLSGKKEEVDLKKLAGLGKVKLFVCGPTVYDYQHIGNGKTQLVFDLFVKFLRSRGHKVFYLQNITDIDDKIIARAKEKGVSPQSLADEFYQIYREDVKSLGITSVDKYARATRYIRQIVRQVKTLIEKGYAYKIEDGYYFNIAKFPEYGKLARRTVEAAEDGVSRIDDSVGKINKGDFALWKLWSGDPSEPYWSTSLGKGRPGWHIEDTAISEKFFGPQYHIHGGGLDLKFPHHEAEIAQQEAASGKKPFVQFWMHSGLVSVDGVKMSKSLGNFITIRNFLEKCSAETFRYIVLMHHYRSPINYTQSLQKQSEESISALKEFVARLDLVIKKHMGLKIGPRYSVKGVLQETEKKFIGALEDDFNTPSALAALFEMVSNLQNKVWTLTAKDAFDVKRLLISKFKVWGISIKPGKPSLPALKIMRARVKARADKQFIQSDELRKRLEELGYKVEDTPIGQLVFKN